MTTERIIPIVATETSVEPVEAEAVPVAVVAPIVPVEPVAAVEPASYEPVPSRYEKTAGTLEGDFAAGQEEEPRTGTVQPIGDFASGEEAAPIDPTIAPADFAAGEEAALIAPTIARARTIDIGGSSGFAIRDSSRSAW